MRRVVVGHDDGGRSTVVSDGNMPPQAMPGVGTIFRAWSTDSVANYPDDGKPVELPGLFPPVGGMRATFTTFQPGDKVADGSVNDEWSNCTMHRSDTTDIGVVMEGEIVLGTEGGEVALRRGDVAVIAGANHYWRCDSPATVLFFLVGASRNCDDNATAKLVSHDACE